MNMLVDFWESNEGEEEAERWPAGNTYVNHWDSPTYMLPLANPKLKGGGKDIQRTVLDSVQQALQAWTGQSLVFTSLYGVRVYKEGAILSPHIDRLPLVTSAIINIAQDVDEPWPLEVIGHDGTATNGKTKYFTATGCNLLHTSFLLQYLVIFNVSVTLEPGEMVLYESHSVLHGKYLSRHD